MQFKKTTIRFSWLSILLVSMIFLSCQKPFPSLADFNEQVWKEDRYACAGKRAALVESLLVQKEKLLALDEMEIVKVLGKPDRNELYKRNQKFYYYFIQPGDGCTSATPHASPQKLAVRFNAMGLAKEITLQ